METADILQIIGVSQEQVDAWKQKYNGEVHLLTVRAKGSDENHYAIVRTPDRIIKKRVSQYFEEPVKASEILVDESWLAGDEKIKTDEKLFYGAAGQISKLMEIGEAEIAKL